MLTSNLKHSTLCANLKRCSLTPFVSRALAKQLNTNASLRRSYLYVPSSSDRMLEKSLDAGSDVIIYDLEDSVSPSPAHKLNARGKLKKFLSTLSRPPSETSRIAVRVNGISTPFFQDDITEIVSNLNVKAIVLPKIHSAEDLDFVSDALQKAPLAEVRAVPIDIIPSIESARGLWNLGQIAGWKSQHEPRFGGEVGTLLFAAEDYCADTSVIRSPSRRELLYTRSQIVIAAKAFGLDAVDMVCVNYCDEGYLKEECLDGRQLGFSGKQAIHPSQVPIILSTFVPTNEEILRAAKILRAMEVAHASDKGAVGLDGEMVDAPMLKQAQKTIATAELAGLTIPKL